MEEQWKNIMGYEGIYQVSSIGNVRSVDRVDSGGRKRYGREMKHYLNDRGYPQLTLSKNSKEKSWRVHRLLALAFIPLVEGKEIINHKDGIKTNCTVENLEWCTYSENSQHAYSNGLINTKNRVYKKYPRSLLFPKSKVLSADIVLEIRARYEDYKNGNKFNITDVSKEYGIKRRTFYNIVNRDTWKQI